MNHDGGPIRLPHYLRIEEHLRQLISDGVGLDSPLPTEEALARSFNVSRMTAREAYRRLENTGLVIRKRGLGTFARPVHLRENLEQIAFSSISDQWAMQGRRLRADVLQYELVAASAPFARAFAVGTGDALTYLERIRYADSVPVSWDERYARRDLFDRVDKLELRETSLLTLARRLGWEVRSGEFAIGAEAASSRLASLLAVKRRASLLVRQLDFMDQEGRTVIHGVSKAPADRIGYSISVTLGDGP